jgi:hypothetical protein
MEAKPTRPINVYFSYSHKDQRYRNQLETQMTLLKREGLISTWHGHKIGAGEEREITLSRYLNTAQIILLLVSSDFIVDDDLYELEVMRAMMRHNDGEACVIPIILRPCDWHKAPFGKLQALPINGKPITDRSWRSLDEAFYDVTQGIRKVVEKLNTKTVEGDRHQIIASQSSKTAPYPIFSPINVAIPSGVIVRAVHKNSKDREFFVSTQSTSEFLRVPSYMSGALWYTFEMTNPQDGEFLVGAQSTSEVEGLPSSNGQDICLTFDMTNPQQMEMRVQDISVEVLDYHEVDILEVSPTLSAGKTRWYFCNIKPNLGIYPCVQLSNEFDYIKLSYGELEHFSIYVNTITEGIYKLRVKMTVSVAGKVQDVIVGDVQEEVGFFNWNNMSSKFTQSREIDATFSPVSIKEIVEWGDWRQELESAED